MAQIDELAERIASLPLAEQEELLERLATLTFQKGWSALAEKYRERLRQQGKLNESVEATWEELRRVREEVAGRDYPR